jgi:hypothetical protein
MTIKHLSGIADATVVVHYDKTDFGRIYLGDVGMRNQLGGGKGLYVNGQDRYLSHGQDATFVRTGDVMLSISQGRIGKMIDKTAFEVSF